VSRRKALVSTQPQVGLAYAGYVPGLIRRRPGLIDYVEIPFERLCHDSSTAEVLELAPAILHCASLSIAGVLPVGSDITCKVRDWARRTCTPWIGEHLAFVRAPGEEGNVEIGYTVAPPLNGTTLARVIGACQHHQLELGTRIILENPPQYFDTPGSTMDQMAFLAAICRDSSIDLLLDVSHLLITTCNTGVDPIRALERLPLGRVREVHLSGIAVEQGVAWDDHGTPASDEAFELLRFVLERARPAAVTLEYNWAGSFGEDVVVRDIERARRMTGTVAA
jgi:uncharacterized protein